MGWTYPGHFSYNFLPRRPKKGDRNMKEKKRIGHDDRINIQAAIAKGWTLAQTAKLLSKPRSTVYREILGNLTHKDCRHSCSHCKKGCPRSERPPYRNGECPLFEARECERWKSWPYCCNGCPEAQFCSDRKRYYDCVDADALSVRKRHEPRVYKGISDEEIAKMDSIVSEGVLKGQSLHHIHESDDALKAICCERTVRRYVYAGYLSVKAHQLPRYVRFSHKYDHSERKPVNVARMLGRTYSDYRRFVESHPEANLWQYDSVEGKAADRKAILTITYPEFRFQFGYLISKGNAQSVLRKLKALSKLLGADYADAFECNLSDNGPEFARFHEIEEWGVRAFFTNPYRSTDKASCERNHELIRYVIPKGRSLDGLTQAKVELLFSHINSYVRGSNENRTPYELMLARFGEGFMEAIGVKRIPAKEVLLKPSLLK